MFSNAIVKQPCQNMIKGLTGSQLGLPDYPLACRQHKDYISALEACGLNVTIMPPDEDYPDSTFIEDTCLLTDRCAVITRPGADARKGETASVKQTISRFYNTVEHIRPPGTLDAGDVMMADNCFYIGLSLRTNQEGARQLSAILESFQFTTCTLPLAHVLHLKTGISYLDNDILLTAGEFIDHPALSGFKAIVVPEAEGYAANSLWINGTVLVPAGFPVTLEKIQQAGYKTIELDMSEFQKLDGGLSCLSLRF